MKQYRALTAEEINQLEMQGCTATAWELVTVAPHFSPHYIHFTNFSGTVKLGIFDIQFTLRGGVTRHAGISYSTLHESVLGDNILIENSYIANYQIGDNCKIRHVQELFVEGQSSFGNGVEVSVLNETGGREVTIFDHLSAQIAYLQTFYRHRPELIKQLKVMIGRYTESVTSTKGTIGESCDISNCGMLKNIRIGERAQLNGVCRMENGSINSTFETPTIVGEGVIAKNFILSAGAVADSGASITNCFVGQAVHFANYFTAVESLFFTYCQGEQGEACSVFAGPFTVTHHKSTLLIGGYYSFMNAGSGTNQSNHLYRLGPFHQGIMERGCKTASDSYILWPSRIGAFSLVSGRHKNHADTSDLPFSYLVDNGGETCLIPGATLRNIGTIRDMQKWKTRDTLKTKKRLDCINSSLFTPYTAQKMVRAIDLLRSLQNQQGLDAEHYNYKGVIIYASSLRKGIRLFEMALISYFGEALVQRIIRSNSTSLDDLIAEISTTVDSKESSWIDLSGLIVPQNWIDQLQNKIEDKSTSTIEEVDVQFHEYHRQYELAEWSWIVRELERKFEVKRDKWTSDKLIAFIQTYISALQFTHQNLEADARKEFSQVISTGFGIDGGTAEQRGDFEAVRGKFEEHPVAEKLMQKTEESRNEASIAIEHLKTKFKGHSTK